MSYLWKYDISIRLAQVEQVRFQTPRRRWVKRTHYMIHWWRTHGGSDLVHIRRDIIRSINSSGAYLSIMVRFSRCMTRDPEDLCHFSHSHPKSWVSLNKWRKSQSYVQIQFFSSEKIFSFTINKEKNERKIQVSHASLITWLFLI